MKTIQCFSIDDFDSILMLETRINIDQVIGNPFQLFPSFVTI